MVSPFALNWIFLFILVDAGYCIIHVLLTYEFLHFHSFSLSAERGYAENYQYIKYVVAAGGLLLTFRGDGGRIRVALAGLLLFLFFEDALAIHEHVGELLNPLFPLPDVAGLPPSEIWSAIYGIGVGGTLFGATALLLLYTSGRSLAIRMAGILACILVLGFAGVVVDTLHAITQFGEGTSVFANMVLVLIEEGLEMISMSALLGLVLDDNYRYATDRVSVERSASPLHAQVAE